MARKGTRKHGGKLAGWQRSLLGAFGDALNNVQEARLVLGAIYLALTTADQGLLESLGVKVSSEDLPKAMPKAVALRRLNSLYPNAKDALGYALTAGTLSRLGAAYKGMEGGARHGGWSVSLADLGLLSLTPGELSDLVERMNAGEVRIKDVVRQVNRVKADAENVGAAQKVIRAKLAKVAEEQAAPTTPEQVEAQRSAAIEKLTKEIERLEAKLQEKREALAALQGEQQDTTEGGLMGLVNSLLVTDATQPAASA